MYRFRKRTISIVLTLCFILQGLLVPTAFAREGDCGYEGGVSSGEAAGKTSFEYQEICFVTGEPLIFKGTLTIRKSSRKDTKTKQDIITTTYTYDLQNAEKAATLKRTLVHSTRVTQTDNGQIIEETSLARTPSETLRIGSQTYTLISTEFTRTRLTDTCPAVNYHAGNFWSRKTYRTGSGVNAGSATVTVDVTGEFYGYDQYWGSTEAQVLVYDISGERKTADLMDRWGGTAVVRISLSTVKDLRYVEHLPDPMSLPGGFLQIQSNNGILEYESRLPEFDTDGISTGRVITRSGSLMVESFPVQTRLKVPTIDIIKAHPAEREMGLMFSLGIFDESEPGFDPEDFMTRAEFAKAVVEAAKEVPADPALASKTAAVVKKKAEEPVSPFADVTVGHKYFEAIKTAYERGLMTGTGQGAFRPDDYITVAEIILTLVRAMGLENMAPGPGAVTVFRDNDRIPEYARKAAYVSERIGLLTADENGYLHPEARVTKAEAAVVLSRFIEYMRDDMRLDYRDRIVNYSW